MLDPYQRARLRSIAPQILHPPGSRILPALFAVVVVCIPFAEFWMLPSQFRDFGQSVMAVSVFASNVFFMQHTGYFSPDVQMAPLLHTWSLAVEEQFYILFPLLVFLLRRLGNRHLFAVLVALSVVSLALSEWGWRYAPVSNFYLLPPRAWELLVGALCGLVQAHQAPRANGLLAAGGIALIFFSIFAFEFFHSLSLLLDAGPGRGYRSDHPFRR